MVDVPQVPSPGLSAKFALLWATNKPLAIFLIALVFLLIAGIIFLIVWFTVIAPKNASQANQVKTQKPAETVAVSPTSTSTTSTTSTSSTHTSTTPAHFIQLRHY